MKKGLKLLNKFLRTIEKLGNILPHPATLFAIFALLVLIFSYIAFHSDWSATASVLQNTFSTTVYPVNLLSKEGIHNILITLVENFTSFAPLGVVVVAMLGIGVAEESGLINASIRLLIASTPKKLITFVVIFTGVMSNVAADSGHVLIIPLSGIIFLSLGRHPILGMAAAFAGVSGGYSANMLLGTLDPLLAGLSTEAAQIIDDRYIVTPTANYYFMAISAILLSISGTWVTEKIVAPMLGDYKNKQEEENNNLEKLTAIERKGIRRVTILSIILFVILLILLIPEDSFFRGNDGTILESPLIKGIIGLLFVMATITGILYGYTTKKFKSNADIIESMSKSVKSLAGYIVLVFFASQFVAFFKMSNIGIIVAIKGANFIQHTGVGIIPLTIMFVLFSATINLLMGSASAKWAIMGPIFIPMFMLAGYSPELTQAIYRIGDSSTNIISPMLSFFPLVIIFVQKYDKKAGIGTIISMMLPYSVVFIFVWTLLMIIWIALGLPLGPGAGIFYP